MLKYDFPLETSIKLLRNDHQNFITFGISLNLFYFFNQNLQNCNFVPSKHILTIQTMFSNFVGMIRTL